MTEETEANLYRRMLRESLQRLGGEYALVSMEALQFRRALMHLAHSQKYDEATREYASAVLSGEAIEPSTKPTKSLFVSYSFVEEGAAGFGQIVIRPGNSPKTSDEVMELVDFIRSDTKREQVVLVSWQELEDIEQ